MIIAIEKGSSKYSKGTNFKLDVVEIRFLRSVLIQKEPSSITNYLVWCPLGIIELKAMQVLRSHIIIIFFFFGKLRRRREAK